MRGAEKRGEAQARAPYCCEVVAALPAAAFVAAAAVDSAARVGFFTGEEGRADASADTSAAVVGNPATARPLAALAIVLLLLFGLRKLLRLEEGTVAADAEAEDALAAAAGRVSGGVAAVELLAVVEAAESAEAGGASSTTTSSEASLLAPSAPAAKAENLL
jgi:hypothetical protein